MGRLERSYERRKVDPMRTILIALAALAVLPATGCGSDDGTSSADNLTQAAKKLIGNYVNHGDGPLRAIVLTDEVASPNANRFFAYVDNDAVCIKAPCPTTDRVEGVFTGGSKTISFRAPE